MKVPGLDDDFILLEQDAYKKEHLANLAIALCDRHTGIGTNIIL